MKINHIKGQNFKGFSNLDLDLEGKSTVIFGINGVGKTSILEVVNYLCWSWINRMNPSQGVTFKSLNANLVKKGTSKMEIAIEISLSDESFFLSKSYTKARPGKGAVSDANKKLYDKFVNRFVELFAEENSNMPIFVNYGTNRSVLDIHCA